MLRKIHMALDFFISKIRRKSSFRICTTKEIKFFKLDRLIKIRIGISNASSTPQPRRDWSRSHGVQVINADGIANRREVVAFDRHNGRRPFSLGFHTRGIDALAPSTARFPFPFRWGGGALAAIVVAVAVAFAVPALAHDVKDPVCRMTVDSDTTPYQRVVDGKIYYFCSEKCESQFDKSPKHYIDLMARLSADGGAGYTTTLASTHAVAGKPFRIQFTVRNNKTHKIVTDYQITHTKLLHLILVSSDLSWFEHQHPVLDKDGTFRLSWTFPHPGRYYLFADFTPVDGDNQIKRMTVDVTPNPIVGQASLPVDGDSRPSSSPLPSEERASGPTGIMPVRRAPGEGPGVRGLRPEKPHTVTVGETKVAIGVVNPPFVVGKQVLITYRFTDKGGKPVTDMQPFLGIMGHMIAISADATHCVHIHVLHGVAPGSYGAAMLPIMQAADPLKVTPAMDTLTGPEFSFKLTLPTAGVYRVWAQFMRHNKVVTVPFTVEAAAAPES